jgi:tetratricopeptide (TPR) repeat protein
LYGQDDARISATWQVQKYDINAALPQTEADRNLTVKARLELKNVSQRPASTLTLRISPSAEITSVNVNGTATDAAKGEEKVATGSLQRLQVRMPAVPPGGNVTATVDYKLSIKENSGLNSLSPAGSQFLPLSYWYPTPNSWFFARGADFAPVRIQLAGTSLQVVAAGTESGGAYDLKLSGQPFFSVGAWEKVDASGVSVYVPNGATAEERKRAAELASLASDAKAFAVTLLGNAPEVPVRIVPVRRGGGFTSGGVILVDENVLRRPKIDSLTAMTIAESIAKMWLGNAITTTGDGYGALREGLTKYIATEFLESKFGSEVADVERARQRAAYSAVSQRDAPLAQVSPLDDYYYAEVANKGAMVWRLLGKRVGRSTLFANLRSPMGDGNLTLAEARSAFPSEKEFLDAMFDQVTETNLQVGLPQVGNGETRAALRNTGPVDLTVLVAAYTAAGERMSAPATVRGRAFGEVTFKSPNKIVRLEIDPEKLVPQTDYSDDVAPRELTDSDLLLAVKRDFDKQQYAAAEKTARIVLRDYPRYDDVRILLGRSLLAQSRAADAEREFKQVLAEPLPTARSLAWANVGLGDISSRANRNTEAVSFAEAAIKTDAEYGASLAARQIRTKAGGAGGSDDSIKAFFASFDRAAVANRKADIDALVLPGEVSRFASSLTGQVVEWKSQVGPIDKVDANTALVEANLAIRLLNKDPESGTAVYRLQRFGGGWRLAAVEIFEVR